MGRFGGSYFYRSYYLISVQNHKVKNFKRYRVCFFKGVLKVLPRANKFWMSSKTKTTQYKEGGM
jgi:hypothetical protein